MTRKTPKTPMINHNHQGILPETRVGAGTFLDGAGFWDIVRVASLSEHRRLTGRWSCHTETNGNFTQSPILQSRVKPQIDRFPVSDCCYGNFVYGIGSFYWSTGFSLLALDFFYQPERSSTLHARSTAFFAPRLVFRTESGARFPKA